MSITLFCRTKLWVNAERPNGTLFSFTNTFIIYYITIEDSQVGVIDEQSLTT